MQNANNNIFCINKSVRVLGMHSIAGTFYVHVLLYGINKYALNYTRLNIYLHKNVNHINISLMK